MYAITADNNVAFTGAIPEVDLNAVAILQNIGYTFSSQYLMFILEIVI